MTEPTISFLHYVQPEDPRHLRDTCPICITNQATFDQLEAEYNSRGQFPSLSNHSINYLVTQKGA